MPKVNRKAKARPVLSPTKTGFFFHEQPLEGQQVDS